MPATPDADPHGSQRALHRIATIAWMSILLGLLIQALIVGGKLLSGGSLPGPRIFADLAQGVTWSVLVCIGVGIATVIIRARALLMGLIGFVTAPLALGTAKAVQKGVNQLSGGPDEVVSTVLLIIALIKALEYGFLSVMLGRLVLKGDERARSYVALGLGTGLCFGGLIIALGWWLAARAGAPPALPALVGQVINEVLFPAGCAFVIFAAQYVGRHMRLLEAQEATTG